MNFALSDDHILLRDAAQTFVDGETDLSPLLKPGATAGDASYPTNWQKLVALGWTGLIVPEAFGGTGLGCIELSLVASELGRTLMPTPFAGHTFAIWVLMRTGSTTQQESLLGAAATGDIQLALVSPMDDNGVTTHANRLTGVHNFVVDGFTADTLIVAARNTDGRWQWFCVSADSKGVHRSLQPWRDVTRQLARVVFEDVAAEPLAGDVAASWPGVRDRIACYLAAENVGGMRRVLDDTVHYANQRIAFGKPIGSYQAIKHPLAEMLGKVESAATAVLYAGWALDVVDERASLAASMAKAYSSDAYVEATHRSIQIFGAIGFTWEMHNHLYFKRARANAVLFGDSRSHREHVVNVATGRTWSSVFADVA